MKEEIVRARLPAEDEVLGKVELMLGGDMMSVICEDGKKRICRIPGRLRKRVWISPGDLVLVKPWKIKSDERGDVVFRYTPTQANWLKSKGLIKNLEI